jgi:hypothetical protein
MPVNLIFMRGKYNKIRRGFLDLWIKNTVGPTFT